MGFKVIDGGHTNQGFPDSENMKWRVLETTSVKIGLFQGMFKNNIMTFYSKDVLSIQNHLKEKGILFSKEGSIDSPDGYVSAMLTDPDGNEIMFDQV